MLYVFGGLPGTGKTTLASRLAREREAAYLRIDTIEQTLRDAGGPVDGPEGYLVAYAVAEENIRLGLDVVADSVNPLRITREAWRDVARRAGAAVIEIEVTCSDPDEHRRRVEARSTDVAGLRLPTWADVVGREYEPWDGERLLIDTAGHTVEKSFAFLGSTLQNWMKPQRKR